VTVLGVLLLIVLSCVADREVEAVEPEGRKEVDTNKGG
jgi:hypothetical protein